MTSGILIKEVNKSHHVGLISFASSPLFTALKKLRCETYLNCLFHTYMFNVTMPINTTKTQKETKSRHKWHALRCYALRVHACVYSSQDDSQVTHLLPENEDIQLTSHPIILS